MRHVAKLSLLCFALAACSDDDEPKNGDANDLFGDEAEPGGVNEVVKSECIPLTESLENYYTPGQDDDWPECIADNGKFTPMNPSISSSARTQAFEEIGKLLFHADKDPSSDDFLEARMLYEEEEGLGSRVVRRYDPHFAPIGDADCTMESDVVKNPDYCAGPAKILPIVRRAFKNGYEGVEPRFHAGRVEGALLWFSAISEYKETLSCSEDDIADCDSAYGYYNAAGKNLGLGRYIREVDPDADDAARLGALAVSCWRDVDTDLPATNLTLREQARTQFDRGVLKGVVSVLASRIDAAVKAEGDAQRFHWGFVTALLGAIESQAYRSDGADETIAAARIAASPSEIDSDELKAALQGIVDCE